MLASFFTNPWMLSALVAISIPIIIEWLFKRRKRRVDLPTIIFLLQNKEQEKIKRQDRILLILRTIAVGLFVLGLARPLLQAGLLRDGPRSVVVLMDGTTSTHQQVGVTTSFGLAQKKAAALIRALPKGTQVTVGFLGERADLILDKEPDLLTVAHRVETLRAGGAAPMSEGLTWAKEYVEREKWSDAELYVFSDFQKYTWQRAGAAATQITQALNELEKRCTTHLVDVGGTPAFNYLVTGLRPSEWLLSTGKPTRFTAEIEARGKPPPDAKAQTLFLVDGDKKDVREVSPGEHPTQAVFEHRFTKAGEYLVEVVVEGDSHLVDNRFLYLCTVPESVRVLVLDREGAAAGAETFCLARAIAPLTQPGKDRVSRFVVQTSAHAQAAFENFGDYAAVVVAAANPLNEALAAKLERYVRDGGAAWLFLGDVSPYEYNKLLFKDGRGLLPARLADKAAEGTGALRLVAGDGHPAVAAWASGQVNANAEVTRYFPLDQKEGSDPFKVVLALGNNAPLAVERAYGRGKVILFNITAGPSWSSLPAAPAFPVMVQEMLRYLIGNPDARVNLSVGDRFEQEVMVSSQHLLLRRPDGTKDRLTPRKKDEKENAWSVSYDRTGVEGVYQFVDVAEEVLARRRFVVNPRAEEGDLTRLEYGDFKDLFGSGGWTWIGPERSVEEYVSRTHSVTELSPWVLGLLIAALGMETYLVVRFGMRRAETPA